MTMHIVFKQNKDGYREGQTCYVERALARRFCRDGVAIPYQKYLDDIYDAEQIKKEADEKRKVELLKAKTKKEKAVSKKATTRNKSIKK